jgi:galactose mutarotase-like enzyme
MKWENLKAFSIENEKIRIVGTQELGGKILSCIWKPSNFEFVSKTGASRYNQPTTGSRFSDFDASGFDDAFPNIDEEIFLYNSRFIKCFDHGEVWSSKFNIISKNLFSISLATNLFCGVRYQKTITLIEDSIHLDYEIQNISELPVPCVWTFHGLFVYEKDMKIFYPPKVDEFINVTDNSKLKLKGDIYNIKNDYYNFNIVPQDNVALKYYVNGRCSNGYCGFTYPSHNLSVAISYNSQLLPYLGVWINVGKFKGDYNCALEPSTGFYDSLSCAAHNNTLVILKPKQILKFGMQMRIISE